MSQSILIVDDEEQVRDVLTPFFGSAQFDIHKAENVLDALKIMETSSVDVVISDYRMAGIIGIEFLTMVKHKFPNTIRILYTAYANFDVAISAINEGEVFRLFTKPCNFSDLYIAVQQALERNSKSMIGNHFPGAERTDAAMSKEPVKECRRLSEINKYRGGYQLRQSAENFAS
jgi:DNA-binding NtrC family response regulator